MTNETLLPAEPEITDQAPTIVSPDVYALLAAREAERDDKLVLVTALRAKVDAATARVAAAGAKAAELAKRAGNGEAVTSDELDAASLDHATADRALGIHTNALNNVAIPAANKAEEDRLNADRARAEHEAKLLLRPVGEREIALAEAADAFMQAIDSLRTAIAEQQAAEHVAGQLRFQLGLVPINATYTHLQNPAGADRLGLALPQEIIEGVRAALYPKRLDFRASGEAKIAKANRP